MENQNKTFGRIAAGYKPIRVKSRTMGNLCRDGLPIIYNRPYPILQAERQKLIRQGINKNTLKIVSVDVQPRYRAKGI